MFTAHATIDTYDTKRMPVWLLVAMCLLPATQALVAEFLHYHPVWTYPILKGMMIAVPVAVWRARHWSLRSVGAALGVKKARWRWGLFVGAMMSGTILGGYYLFFFRRLDGGPLMAEIESVGFGPWHFILMAMLISLWNSLFEEYYWRGFILSELRTWIPKSATVWCVGAGAFGLHHIFALAPLFSWPHVILFTAGTMVGGGVWTWMRLRGDSLIDCYVSHIMADLSIMWIGWDLLTSA